MLDQTMQENNCREYRVFISFISFIVATPARYREAQYYDIKYL
jgi:hypothetical protein